MHISSLYLNKKEKNKKKQVEKLKKKKKNQQYAKSVCSNEHSTKRTAIFLKGKLQSVEYVQ